MLDVKQVVTIAVGALLFWSWLCRELEQFCRRVERGEEW